MDLIDKLKSIGERIEKLKEQVNTEEATKNAFVMPFIQALGFDVFNPTEVVPEYTADTGIKKGEKVDYCLFKDNTPIMIIECKHWKEKLDNHDSQLLRYFHVSQARFGMLTNGIEYRFFTDLDTPNKMDERPFFDFTLDKVTESVIEELKKFQKHSFDIDTIVSNANDLKYSKELKNELRAEFNNPSEDFVRYLASKVYSGRVTTKVVEQFTDLTKKSIKQLLGEMINERLEKAISSEDVELPTTVEATVSEETKSVPVDNPDIETTEEELQAFRVVQAILMPEIESKRIFYRDSKSYCAIILDDNNRKPVCRLWFNGGQKYVGLLDENKKETRQPIDEIDDIYNYKDEIRESAMRYA